MKDIKSVTTTPIPFDLSFIGENGMKYANTPQKMDIAKKVNEIIDFIGILSKQVGEMSLHENVALCFKEHNEMNQTIQRQAKEIELLEKCFNRWCPDEAKEIEQELEKLRKESR